MGKFLEIIGVDKNQQKNLPEDIFKAEELLDGLQQIYAKSPDSNKKKQLAVAISESVRLLLLQVQKYKAEQPEEENQKETETETTTTDRPQRTPKEKPKKEIPRAESTTTAAPTTETTTQTTVPEEMEEYSCDELKTTIKGLSLLAKIGDVEASELVKKLKQKYKLQNCK